jgi:uncharacterized protein (DUF2249 family)
MTALSPEATWLELVSTHETTFERLVAHDPKIAKFGRVLGDERVADRLTVQDVAHMLNLPAPTLLAVAAGAAVVEPPIQAPPSPAEDAVSTGAVMQRVRLDLRPVFADGHEPLGLILDEIDRLPDGAALVIEAPFHPVPLRRLLGGRGYDSAARQVAADHWRVAFRRPAPPA